MSSEYPKDEAVVVAESMIANGNSFIGALGLAILNGGPNSREKIKAAFPEYWRAYKLLAIRFDEEEQ